jgi:L,D-transpeptidase YcbB
MNLRQPCRNISLFFLLLVFFIVSCGPQRTKKPSPSGFSDDKFIQALKGILKPVDALNNKKIRQVWEEVRFTYQSDDYQPIWLKENYASNDAAAKLIDELEDIRWDGIDPERYNLAAIKKLKLKLDTTKANSVEDAIIFDTTLTHSYLAAAKDLLIGRIRPKSVDSLWYHVNDSEWNAPQLLVGAKGKYPSLNDFRSEVPTYELLRSEYKRYTAMVSDSALLDAIDRMRHMKYIDSEMLDNIHAIIKAELPWVVTVADDSISEEKQLIFAYQDYRSIRLTGKLDSITLVNLAIHPSVFLKKLSANMERVRWMQKQFGSLYLVVDVPLMELFLRKDGVNVMHMRVVVGRPERQTPSLFATMANVVINPPWGVPPTILKNDVLPGLQKSSKKYLDKKGLKVYDREGKMVNASKINAQNYRRYNYKQAPGNDNSLGYVKFNLPNPWDIYLHDTPHRDDFGKSFRALSSGCIRLQHPKEMALYILDEFEKKNYTPGKLDTLISTHRTKWEYLKNKIPVHITYLTAFEDTSGKHIRFARDIYHRDDSLMVLMN